VRVGTSKFLLLKEINKGLLIACRYKLSRPMKNRQTSTASFATKPTRSRPTHPFLGAALLQRHFRVRWRAPHPPPPHTHTRRMDGFCNQNADQLGSLGGLSFPAVYVGVVECASGSPYTYSSPHIWTSACAELGSGLDLGLGLGAHFAPHAPSCAPLFLATLLSHNIPFPRVH